MGTRPGEPGGAQANGAEQAEIDRHRRPRPLALARARHGGQEDDRCQTHRDRQAEQRETSGAERDEVPFPGPAGAPDGNERSQAPACHALPKELEPDVTHDPDQRQSGGSRRKLGIQVAFGQLPQRPR